MKLTHFFTLFFLLTLNAIFSVSPEDKHRLLVAAQEARTKAYAPYSEYLVGAAVLTKDGTIYSGANVENASYGLTICAERNATCTCVFNGHKDIEAVAVVIKDIGAPCGGCRQVLNEFNPNMEVYLANEDLTLIEEYNLSQLLPHAFGPGNLE